MIKIIIYISSFILLSFSFFSCKTKKETTTTQKDLIIFYTFNMSHDSISGEHHISLINTIANTGTLKNDLAIQTVEKPEHYICSFLDSTNTIIKSHVFPSPLIQRHEFADNDGVLKSVIINKKESDFIIRTQYNPNYKFAVFKHIDSKKDIHKVSSIKLKGYDRKKEQNQ